MSIKFNFGSGIAKHLDIDGLRYLSGAILDPGDSDFSLSSQKIFIGGVPVALYFSNSLSQYAIGLCEISGAVPNDEEMMLKGYGMQTESLNNFRCIKISESNSITPSKEIIFNGFPLAATADDDIVFVKYAGTDAEETSEAFINGTPVLCKRFGSNWFLSASIISGIDDFGTAGAGDSVDAGEDPDDVSIPVSCPEEPSATISIDGWHRLFLGAVKTWTPLFGGQCVESQNIYAKATGPGELNIFDGTLYWNPASFGENCGWTQIVEAPSPNFGYVWIEVDVPFNVNNQYIWRCSWWVRLKSGTPDRWEMRIDIANNSGQFLNSAYLYKDHGSTPRGNYTFNAADSSLGVTNPGSCYAFSPTTIRVV